MGKDEDSVSSTSTKDILCIADDAFEAPSIHMSYPRTQTLKMK